LPGRTVFVTLRRRRVGNRPFTAFELPEAVRVVRQFLSDLPDEDNINDANNGHIRNAVPKCIELMLRE
jgi:hypothetical protein